MELFRKRDGELATISFPERKSQPVQRIRRSRADSTYEGDEGSHNSTDRLWWPKQFKTPGGFTSVTLTACGEEEAGEPSQLSDESGFDSCRDLFDNR